MTEVDVVASTLSRDACVPFCCKRCPRLSSEIFKTLVSERKMCLEKSAIRSLPSSCDVQ